MSSPPPLPSLCLNVLIQDLFRTSARKPLPQLRGESACQKEPTAPAHHHPAVGKQEPVVECQDCVNKRTTVGLYPVWSKSCGVSLRLQGHSSTPAGFKMQNQREKSMWKPWNVRGVWLLVLSSRQKKTYSRCRSSRNKRLWVEKKKIMQAFPGLVPSDRYYSTTHPWTNPGLSLNTWAEKIVTALSSRLIHPWTGAFLKQCIFFVNTKRVIGVCRKKEDMSNRFSVCHWVT